MAKPFASLLLGLGLAAGLACGRKGPLELPPGREPMAVEGLTAVQRGRAVVLTWTNPVKAVSGRSLTAIDAVEIWVFDRGLPAGGSGRPAAKVENEARLAQRIPKEEMAALCGPAGPNASGMAFPFVFDPGPGGPQKLAFAVRVLDSKKRPSDFSSPAEAEIQTCPEPPLAVNACAFSDFIEVSWLPPASNIDGTRPAAVGGYAVYRREGGEGPERKRALLPADALRFEDRDFGFGKGYAYFVRAVAAPAEGAVESGDSSTAKIVPLDVFPPAAPAGLVAIAGEGLVSLNWLPVRDRDLDGYRVWRKEAANPDFAPLGGGLVREIVFSDASAAKGGAYVYAVSAVDRAGNESPKSEGTAVVAKGAKP